MIHKQFAASSTFVIQLSHFLCSRICQSKTAFFDSSPNRAFLRSRKRAFSTQLLSTEKSDWRILEKLDFFDWILQSKNSVEKNLHVFF